ncbi:MAG: cupin domain-containing protein [Rhizobiaceae bacterium]|nr:cupin domain-containing protein [Rhizobiaceae bacterium]
MPDIKMFADAADGEWVTTFDGNRRRVILHTDELMMVEFSFVAGGVGQMHSHPHIQASYVVEGSFDVTIDGRTQRIGKGGGYIVPPNLVHGVKALEDGRLVDAFTPHRADFLAS